MSENQQAVRLLTVGEVSERLNASSSFVYQLLASGELRHYVLGRGQGGKRVSEEQLQDYLNRKEQGTRRGPEEKSTPAPAKGSAFTNLDSGRLLSAWQRQGVFADPPGGGSAPSSA